MEQVYRTIDTVYAHTVERTLRTLQVFIAKNLPRSAPSYENAPHEVIELPGESMTPPSSFDSFKTVGAVMEKRAVLENLTNTIAYVGSTRVPLWHAPTKEFDTVTATVPYGTMAMVMEEKGRFSRVIAHEHDGWVLRDDLSDRAAYVYPEFVIGEENDVHDPNTLRLRASIQDEFFGAEAEVPLQAGEYVSYRLMRKGKAIQWPTTRPRTPGRWHQILKGSPGVHMSVGPKTGSIMECTLENDMGHLAYVEAVFPGERITISEVNYPDQGIYNERTLTKEEWQSLNPVFIEVS